MSFLTVFWPMLTLLLFILIGVACFRTGIVNEASSKSISGLIVQVFNPALVFSSVLSNGQNKEGYYIGTSVLVAGGMFVAFIVIGKIIARFLSRDSDEKKGYQMMTVFSNLGFIGIPVVSAIYGTSALIYVAIFMLVYNVVMYTYGVSVLQGTGSKLLSTDNVKNLLNIGTISSLITVFVFYCDVPIHPMLQMLFAYLGNATTPLALMSIGFSLAQSDLLAVFTDKKLYLYSLLKLIVIPAVGVMVLSSLDLPAQVLGVSVIMLSMPIGNMPGIMATQYGVKSDVCTNGVIVTTLLSVLAVPLIVGMI